MQREVCEALVGGHMAELSIKFWVNFELRFVSFFKFKISLKATRSSPSHTFKSVQLYLIP
jgi:hypothetical protein